MLDLLLSLRGFVMVEGIIAGFLYAHIIGSKFFSNGWSYKFTSLGFGALIAYGSSIQVKAYNRHAPFDGYSVLGPIAFTLLIVGMTAYILTRLGDPTDGT